MTNKTVGVGVALALTRVLDDQVYVLMGKRKGSHGAGTWSFPGGHVDYGESALTTAVRELEEETGYTKDQIISICKGPYVETVFVEEQKHYITLLFSGLLSENSPLVAELKEPDKCEYWKWFERGKLPSPLFLPVQNLLQKGYDVFSHPIYKSYPETTL